MRYIRQRWPGYGVMFDRPKITDWKAAFSGSKTSASVAIRRGLEYRLCELLPEVAETEF
jgi:hypothetical protein